MSRPTLSTSKTLERTSSRSTADSSTRGPASPSGSTTQSSTSNQASSPGGAGGERSQELAWFWLGLLGFSMFVGGVIALVIAVTRVVFPYDEQFVGMSRSDMRVNPHLLAFLTHDRVTLAGMMTSSA